jgi:hypothetical protein
MAARTSHPQSSVIYPDWSLAEVVRALDEQYAAGEPIMVLFD